MPQEPSTTSLLLLWYLACCVPFFIKKLFQSRKATQRRYEGQTSYAQSQVHDKNRLYLAQVLPQLRVPSTPHSIGSGLTFTCVVGGETLNTVQSEYFRIRMDPVLLELLGQLYKPGLTWTCLRA